MAHLPGQAITDASTQFAPNWSNDHVIFSSVERLVNDTNGPIPLGTVDQDSILYFKY
jgi:hypothetical protein